METILKMFEHLKWANQQILETLHHKEVENKDVIRLFSHILLAEKVWVTRLQGFDSSNITIWIDGI